MLNGRMSIHQDGRELACSDMDPTLLPDLSATDIQWGNGVFGPCLGALSEETRRWRP